MHFSHLPKFSGQQIYAVVTIVGLTILTIQFFTRRFVYFTLTSLSYVMSL